MYPSHVDVPGHGRITLPTWSDGEMLSAALGVAVLGEPLPIVDARPTYRSWHEALCAIRGERCAADFRAAYLGPHPGPDEREAAMGEYRDAWIPAVPLGTLVPADILDGEECDGEAAGLSSRYRLRGVGLARMRDVHPASELTEFCGPDDTCGAAEVIDYLPASPASGDA